LRHLRAITEKVAADLLIVRRDQRAARSSSFPVARAELPITVQPVISNDRILVVDNTTRRLQPRSIPDSVGAKSRSGATRGAPSELGIHAASAGVLIRPARHPKDAATAWRCRGVCASAFAAVRGVLGTRHRSRVRFAERARAERPAGKTARCTTTAPACSQACRQPVHRDPLPLAAVEEAALPP